MKKVWNKPTFSSLSKQTVQGGTYFATFETVVTCTDCVVATVTGTNCPGTIGAVLHFTGYTAPLGPAGSVNNSLYWSGIAATNTSLAGTSGCFCPTCS